MSLSLKTDDNNCLVTKNGSEQIQIQKFYIPLTDYDQLVSNWTRYQDDSKREKASCNLQQHSHYLKFRSWPERMILYKIDLKAGISQT